MTAHDEVPRLRSLRSTFERRERRSKRARTRNLRLIGIGPYTFLSRPLSYLGQGNVAIKVLLLFNLTFNLTDLTTSFVALRAGLAEGNPLILGISAAIGLNILGSLALMKILFLVVASTAALTGTRSTDRGTRNLMMGFLLTTALIFLIVSLSNILSMAV